MIHFTLSTNRSNTNHDETVFYILSRGKNTGKPLKKPCANCYVVHLKNPNQLEALYGICYNLWKINFWHRHLIGSVILYIRIKDFNQLLQQKINKSTFTLEQVKQCAELLKSLDAKEELLNKTQEHLRLLRLSIIHKYMQ